MASAAQAFESSEAAPSQQELIEKRAYQLFQDRGEQHGFEVEDWLTAEAGIRSEVSPPAMEDLDAVSTQDDDSAVPLSLPIAL